MRYEGSCEALGSALEPVVNNPFEGIMAIDAEGRLTFINDFFLEPFRRPREEVLGQRIWDLVPGCRLFETVAQGYSIWGETLRLGDHDFLVARFPLKQGSRTVGAMVKTLFPDASVAKEITHKLSHAGEAGLTPTARCSAPAATSSARPPPCSG